MSRTNPWVPCIVTVLLIAVSVGGGCKKRPTTEDATVPVAGPTVALALKGPAGTVSVGDQLDDAKRAFPPPEGAEVVEEPTSLAGLGEAGWAWGAGMGTGFEAAATGGRIVALKWSRLDGPAESTAKSDQTRAIGEPTISAESENATVLVWVSGDHARFHVIYWRDVPLMGVGEETVIGPKEALKSLGFFHDDPGSYVRQVDAAVGVQPLL